jgi:hypothetical protein
MIERAVGSREHRGAHQVTGEADDRVLWRVRREPRHVPTGACKHYLGENLAPPPASLMIVSLAGDPGVTLVHLDEEGREITDTYHTSVRDAFEQARGEFGLDPTEWTRADPDESY